MLQASAVAAQPASAGASAPTALDTGSEVERLIEEGLSFRELGKDQEALAAFERAHGLAPTPRTQAQIGFAQQALGRWLDAERSLLAALAASGDDWIVSHRAILEKSLTVIADHLGTVEVVGGTEGAEVLVDGLPAGTVPLASPLRVETGMRLVELRREGFYPMSRSVAIRPQGRARASFEAMRVWTASGPAGGEGGSSTRAERGAGSDGTTQRIVGWSILGVSAAALAFGGIAATVGQVNAANYNDSMCPGDGVPQTPACDDRLARANGWTTAGIVSGIAGGALAIGGVALILTAPRGTAPSSAIALQIGPARESGLEARWHVRF